MKVVDQHEYTTYPRRFTAYKWFKPLLVLALGIIFLTVMSMVVDILTKLLFGSTSSASGYDGMDFFTAKGAFDNGLSAAVYIPSIVCWRR